MLWVNRIPYLRGKFAQYARQMRRQETDRDTAELYRRLVATPAPLIFDVGANVGQSVALFLRLFDRPTIHCFEPDPAAFEALKQKYGGRADVVLNNIALSDAKATARFYQQPQSKLSGLVEYNYQAYVDEMVSKNRDAALGEDAYNKQIEVETDTLDAYAARLGADRIDVLKIDVQGGEALVLSGAKNALQNGNVGLICLELIFRNLYKDGLSFHEIENHLHPHSYRLFGMPRKANVKGTPFIEQADLFYSR